VHFLEEFGNGSTTDQHADLTVLADRSVVLYISARRRQRLRRRRPRHDLPLPRRRHRAGGQIRMWS